MDGVALRPLTVDFHEPGFVARLNGEGTDADKLYWGGPANPQALNGPANPQALNRYSYVLNNPMKWTDPSGHSIYLSHDDAEVVAQAFEDLAYNRTYEGNSVVDAATDIVTVVASNLTGPAGAFLGEVANRLLGLKEKGINKLYELAKIIRAQNGVDGVALGGSGNTPYDTGVYVLDRYTGKARLVEMEYGVYLTLFRDNNEIDIGMAFGDDVGHGHFAFTDDMDDHYFHADRSVCLAEGANDC